MRRGVMGCPKKGVAVGGGGVLRGSAIAQQIAALISGCNRSEAALPACLSLIRMMDRLKYL